MALHLVDDDDDDVDDDDDDDDSRIMGKGSSGRDGTSAKVALILVGR